MILRIDLTGKWIVCVGVERIDFGCTETTYSKRMALGYKIKVITRPW